MPRDEEVHDPQDSFEAEEWLAKAERDLAAASRLVSATPPLTGTAVFHAQQAAEKSWKALLAWHATPFGKTHDLKQLGQQLAQRDPGLHDLILRAANLTPFAWLFRYPGESDEPTPEEARVALDIATQVFAAARLRTKGS
jgi:HEPN domain-containing protein